ncbi:DNA mismatch repair protein MutS, partial [Acidithiobacillus ferridurans]|nr:DNA mismatch repair protein MutS [Acidithiobacillus ferridurans]
MGRRPDQSEKQERVTGVDDTACFLQAIADVRP